MFVKLIRAQTLKVAKITRMTFSFTADWAASVRRGMISYFLSREGFRRVYRLLWQNADLLISLATSGSKVRSQRQKDTWYVICGSGLSFRIATNLLKCEKGNSVH